MYDGIKKGTKDFLMKLFFILMLTPMGIGTVFAVKSSIPNGWQIFVMLAWFVFGLAGLLFVGGLRVASPDEK